MKPSNNRRRTYCRGASKLTATGERLAALFCVHVTLIRIAFNSLRRLLKLGQHHCRMWALVVPGVLAKISKPILGNYMLSFCVIPYVE